MVSEVDGLTPNNLTDLRLNVVADGLFHALTWTLVFIGVVVLAEVRRSGQPIQPVRRLLGWMAVGCDIFNLVGSIARI